VLTLLTTLAGAQTAGAGAKTAVAQTASPKRPILPQIRYK